MAKEASPASRPRLLVLVQSDMAGEVPWTPAWPPKAGAGPARSERRCL